MSGLDPSFCSERDVEARLDFAFGAGRSFLRRQHVPYPFHVTRPFGLDPNIPQLATLYLQSASGGLYRGDRLALSIAVGAAAAAHVTTQASTLVHDTSGRAAEQGLDLCVEDDSFLAFTADPLILLPGAAVRCKTSVVISDGACLILADGFCCHDPAGANRPFEALSLSLVVRSKSGMALVREQSLIDGMTFLSPASPAGSYQAYGSLLVVAPRRSWPDREQLQKVADDTGCLCGVSLLPFDRGLQLRLLSANGGVLRRGLDAAFALAFEAHWGVPPSPRRK